MIPGSKVKSAADRSVLSGLLARVTRAGVPGMALASGQGYLGTSSVLRVLVRRGLSAMAKPSYLDERSHRKFSRHYGDIA